MKRISIFCMMMLAILGMASAEVKLDSLIWLDTEAYVDTNQNFFVDKGGAFYIGRAYVNLRGDIGKDWFGNKISGRLTVDFTKPLTPIKYAYFDWKFADFIVFSGGLVKSDFGYVQSWEYPIPVKHIADLLKTIPTESADFGIGISGKLLPMEGLTKNLLYYNIQLLNGEGYKAFYSGSTSPANDTFASQYTLAISPLNGTKIGGTYRINPRDYVTSIQNLYWVKSDAYSVYASAKDVEISENLKIPVDFVAEYVAINTSYDGTTNIIQPSTNYTVSGYAFTVMLGYTLFDIFTPYVRYDMVDQNIAENKTNDMDQILYIGANVKVDPKGNMVIKPVYQYYLMKGNKSDLNDWLIKLEFEYKMGFSIWQ
ncbi:MAG: hypothetical protein ACP5QT_03155 [Brevinematia bacterium]